MRNVALSQGSPARFSTESARQTPVDLSQKPSLHTSPPPEQALPMGIGS